jgi:ribonuclease HII
VTVQTALDSLKTRLIYERHFADAGYSAIGGVDEVGRGALAGPLVAAAVILPPVRQLRREAKFWGFVRDSKTLTPSQRTELAHGIHDRARQISLAAIPSTMLDEIGVGAANRLAMELAVRGLAEECDILLIDAMTIDYDVPQVGIIDGDARSVSVAAASIVAKVARDTEMCDLDASFPVFGFARHKGYGVASHLAALQEHGPCPHHRFSFSPVRLCSGLALEHA